MSIYEFLERLDADPFDPVLTALFLGKDVQDMSGMIPGRTLRVRFHSEENDSYVELWQIVGQKKYIARHTYGPKRWYYVSDLLGCRELDRPIEDGVTVIVCGQDGRELFRTSNADEAVGFNTPKQEAYAQWRKYAEDRKLHIDIENHSAQLFVHWATGTRAGSFNQWLLGFQDARLFRLRRWFLWKLF